MRIGARNPMSGILRNAMSDAAVKAANRSQCASLTFLHERIRVSAVAYSRRSNPYGGPQSLGGIHSIRFAVIGLRRYARIVDTTLNPFGFIPDAAIAHAAGIHRRRSPTQ